MIGHLGANGRAAQGHVTRVEHESEPVAVSVVHLVEHARENQQRNGSAIQTKHALLPVCI